jgi:hypothetical protein
MSQVHYEVFVRRTPQAPWKLEIATEDRAQALSSADQIMEDKQAAAVRVTKETLDEDSMEFQSVTLVTKGAPEIQKRQVTRDSSVGPSCSGPADLYHSPARETIQRVLDEWLRRNRVTPFELLHRPDLVEKLEAAGMEVQHAIQKVSIPESQITGQPVHEVIRAYQRLTEQAIERVMKAGRSQQFPVVDTDKIGAVARKLAGHPDRLFLLGGGVAQAIAGADTWRDKVNMLLDLAEAVPDEPKARALCHVVLEQPLAEIVASRAGLSDLIGAGALDLGGGLAALVRIAAPREVDALIRMERGLERLIPPLEGPAVRLGARMDAGDFKMLGTVLARRVVNELTGPRRLRPSDAKDEIEILRALAMALTASAGRLLSLDEVQSAFVQRSRSVVGADFVESYLGHADTAVVEAAALVRLCQNLAGQANKRLGARWLMGCVAALRFEKEIRTSPESAPARLATLAALQRSVFHAELPEMETREITGKIGEVGGLIEADVKVCLQLVRAPVGSVQKLSALLKIATGEAAPLGPAADRAKAEVMKLMRAPEIRQELAASPENAERMKALMQQVSTLAA